MINLLVMSWNCTHANKHLLLIVKRLLFLMLVLSTFYLVTFCVLEVFDNSFIFYCIRTKQTLQYIFCYLLFILDYAYRNEYIFLTKSELSVALSVYWKKYHTVKSVIFQLQKYVLSQSKLFIGNSPK